MGLLVMLAISSFASAASLRDYVCIVRSNYSEKSKEFLTSYKNTMVLHGYKKFGEYIDEYLKGSFGSGFVYAASNGKFYVITNRHVISSAETATLQFEKEDGTYTEYKNMKILGIDEELDIAVIELPASFKGRGLSFRTKKVNDGDEVFTAGFPGLGKDPVWQLGKGSVTNSTARIKELVDPSISVLIQHSGQVDGGNSGGPLLVTDSNYKAGYSVVGVNTWKAISRENTNFAIPADAVKTAVDKIIANKGSSVKIAERIEKFNKSILNEDETFDSMAKYISNEMTSNLKGKVFIDIVDSAKGSSYDKILVTFANDPIEGVKYALAYHIYYSFRKGNKVYEYETGAPEKIDQGYKVSFKIDDKKSNEAIWINENGIWVLGDFNGIIEKGEVATSGKSGLFNPYLVSITGGMGFCEGNSGFVVDGAVFLSGGALYISARKDLPGYNTGYIVGLKVNIPVKVGSFIIEPDGFVGAAMYTSDSYYDDDMLKLVFGGGASFVYCISNSIGIELAANYTRFISISKGSFAVTAGIRFGGTQSASLW